MTGELIDRRALRAVAVQFFINGALFASFVPRLPEIRDRVGISVAGVGRFRWLVFLGCRVSVGVGSADPFGTPAVLLVLEP